MGKRWDYDVPSVEIWAECLRVLKPGGHLVAFAGTRTQHRMAVRIEDAGFEIRDMLAWVYGSGMAKGFNFHRLEACECSGNALPCTHERESKPQHDVPILRHPNLPTSVCFGEEQNCDLLSHLPKQTTWEQSVTHKGGREETGEQNDGREQSGLDWWDLHRAEKGLSHDSQPKPPKGATERLCIGTHTCGRKDAWEAVKRWGGGSSHKQGQTGQPSREFESLCKPLRTLDDRTLFGRGQCPRCGKLKKQLLGFSTAIKPSFEPITLARKPLIGTVAANVLAHGTGGLNIDACRVGNRERPKCVDAKTGSKSAYGEYHYPKSDTPLPDARFPANLIHDGSPEVVALFPNDAQRFFYSAKAQSSERDFGLEGHEVQKAGAMQGSISGDLNWSHEPTYRRNHHPTVKPVDVMKWLVRLVTPPSGIVLDPFMGSGTTGIAAKLQGFGFVGIEREPEYYALAQSRIGSTPFNVPNATPKKGPEKDKSQPTLF
jgi:DNA modification methylase